MQNEFFTRLEDIIFCVDFKEKYTLFQNFYEDFASGELFFNHQHISKNDFNLATPSVVLHPTRIIRPRHSKSEVAIARTIHSVAHIEFCAITLALDSAYRFKNMPIKYYQDWVEVAKEEFLHFFLLEEILGEIGHKYGDFGVHLGLFDAMQLTHDNIKYRMGLVHRGLEARGLDSNPFVLKKLSQSTHSIVKKINEVFAIILRDEIGHVSKGNYWWEATKDKDDDFLGLCERFLDFNLAGKILNKNARLQCGFSSQEIKRLESFYAQKHQKRNSI